MTEKLTDSDSADVQPAQRALTAADRQQVTWGKVIDKTYYYVPVVYVEDINERNEVSQSHWYSLRFNDDSGVASLLGYRGDVCPHETLWQAVRRGLEDDFVFPHDLSFVIDGVLPDIPIPEPAGDSEATTLVIALELPTRVDMADGRHGRTDVAWVDEGYDTFNPVIRCLRA